MKKVSTFGGKDDSLETLTFESILIFKNVTLSTKIILIVKIDVLINKIILHKSYLKESLKKTKHKIYVRISKFIV